jgi:hypothetical protein
MNLVCGNPACYAYANSKKTPTKKNKTSVSVASSSAAKGCKEAMDSMKGIMDTMMGRDMVHLKPPTKKQSIDDDVSSLPVDSSSSASKKKKHLEEKKKMLMEEIKFQKDLGEDYHDQYHEFLSTCSELGNIVDEE